MNEYPFNECWEEIIILSSAKPFLCDEPKYLCSQLPSLEPQATSKCVHKMTVLCIPVLTKVPHGLFCPKNALNMIFERQWHILF